MADLLSGFDVRDLPGDVQRALGIRAATLPGSSAAQLWLPPRWAITAQPEPTDYVAVSTFPRKVYSAQKAAITTGKGVLGGHGWMAPVNGTVYWSGAVSGTAATFQVSLDGGTTWVALSTADLAVDTLGGPYSVLVTAGDWIDFSASASTTGRFLRAVFVADAPA